MNHSPSAFILVTGGAGYIGSETVRALLRSGCFPVIVDDLSTGSRDSVPDAVPFYHGDVRDRQLLQRIFSTHKISAVIHLAARILVDESLREPLLYYDHNVGGLLSLLETCKQFEVKKIIFASSGTTYGDGPIHRGTTTKIDEDQPPSPLSPYGHSKVWGERILKDATSAFGLQSIILRYLNVVGASADGTNGQRRARASHIIHVAAKAATDGSRSVTIHGTDYPTPDGTCVRDYIHVEDIASVHVEALTSLLQNGNSYVFNCGYGRGYSVREILDTFMAANEVKLTIVDGARRPGDPAVLVGDTTRLESTLNWKPRYDSIEFICRSAYRWQRKLSGLS